MQPNILRGYDLILSREANPSDRKQDMQAQMIEIVPKPSHGCLGTTYHE
jgi:hypothetical protein